MRLFEMAGLPALVLIVVPNATATGGSVHIGFTKAEVQAARVELYVHEMHLRAEDPTSFDHKYPVLGKILASEHGFDEFLAKHTFARLLCKHTPFLWRVIDGDILYHKVHPFAPGPLIPNSMPAMHTDGPQWAGGAGGQGHDHDPGGAGGGIPSNAVPEPSSWVLTVTGLAFTLLILARRRIYRLATARQR
jgi:hypothetical protein